MKHRTKTKYINHIFLPICLSSMLLLFSFCATIPAHQEKHHIKSNRHFKVSFIYHASVGWDASFEINDPSVVKLQKRGKSFKHPIKRLLFMSGADEANGYFKFKALKPGNCIIKLHHIFRGTIQKTDTININVY